ncbi:MAG: hypothetical protein JW814_03715 [Candidatus Krumholzibacteriota bacterium]|nr:hypothetical protein [Candidatus Krumholzibacteriota bacterium]
MYREKTDSGDWSLFGAERNIRIKLQSLVVATSFLMLVAGLRPLVERNIARSERSRLIFASELAEQVYSTVDSHPDRSRSGIGRISGFNHDRGTGQAAHGGKSPAGRHAGRLSLLRADVAGEGGLVFHAEAFLVMKKSDDSAARVVVSIRWDGPGGERDVTLSRPCENRSVLEQLAYLEE